MMKHYRYIPKDSTLIEHPEKLGVVYAYMAGTRPAAIAYAGKAGKASWHHSFIGKDGEGQRQRKINEFFAGMTAHQRMLAERKAARKQPHALKVGDVVYNSWGWEQTNVDFYQVVKTTAHYVWLRQLASSTEETGFMCGDTVATPDFASEEITQHRAEGEHIGFKYGSGNKWNGEPKRCSWYA